MAKHTTKQNNRGSRAKTNNQRPGTNGRATQGVLMEVTHPAERELLTMADTYRACRDRRMEALKPEIETRDALLSKMREHGLDRFEHDGITIEVVKGKDKVRVRTTSDEDGDDNET